MSFKDLFSANAASYARYRPSYPAELFAWLAEHAPGRTLALDVGTGNGQAAVALAACFERVVATDPAEAQLANAAPHPRVEYRRASAEASGLPDGAADLVTVAQALHWFPFDAFFAETRRALRPDGLLAVWCYPLTEITPAIDAVVMELYRGYLDAYWEPERKLVESGYRTIAFPFDEITVPPFEMSLTWSVDDLAGYLGTWSPLKRYVAERGENPLDVIIPKLREAWGDEGPRVVRWPLRVRAFRI